MVRTTRLRSKRRRENFPFLYLPMELREMIYMQIFNCGRDSRASSVAGHHRTYDLDRARVTKTPSFAAININRQIRNEALKILFRDFFICINFDRPCDIAVKETLQFYDSLGAGSMLRRLQWDFPDHVHEGESDLDIDFCPGADMRALRHLHIFNVPCCYMIQEASNPLPSKEPKTAEALLKYWCSIRQFPNLLIKLRNLETFSISWRCNAKNDGGRHAEIGKQLEEEVRKLVTQKTEDS